MGQSFREELKFRDSLEAGWFREVEEKQVDSRFRVLWVALTAEHLTGRKPEPSHSL